MFTWTTGSGEHSSESKMKSSICPLLMKLGTKGLNTPESHSLWKKSKGRLNRATSALWLQLGHRAWPGSPLRSGTHRTFPAIGVPLGPGIAARPWSWPLPRAQPFPEPARTLTWTEGSLAGETLLASVPHSHPRQLSTRMPRSWQHHQQEGWLITWHSP